MSRFPAAITGLAVVTVAALVGLSADENWPQFRGLRSGVAADDPALPDTWSASRNVAWKIELPGRGWSSPVVWGDHVFVTAAIDTRASAEPLKPTPSYTPRSFGGPMSGRDVST